jgi:CBS domain-containing protein
MQQILTAIPAQTSLFHPRAAAATIADIVRPPLTTVGQYDHVAAAAYLMKHAGTSALVVLDGHETNRPVGLVTEADIVHAVADGKDVNEVRIHDLMTNAPTVVDGAESIRDAANTMLKGHFRHLPVVGPDGLSGIVDIGDICRALLDMPTN